MISLLSLLLVVNAHAKVRMDKVTGCQAPKGAKEVLLIKQWHLSPTTSTKGFKEKYAQEKNQTAIYQYLNELVKKKKLDIVVAEGCEGEITDGFATAFNGWDLESLAKQSQTKGFDRIVTNVPLKLEARHHGKLLTLCGDNEKMIQEGNLRLSNLRGWAGFWSRLSEPAADAERTRLYAEAAADLLKVKKDTPVKDLREKIRERLKADLDLFKESLTTRNQGFVKALEGREFKTAALVIGGLHAKDLKDRLEKAGYACDVLRPPGYAAQDEELIEEFEKALK
ncbi:MAG TPA: hypothetical protein PKC28_08685 [Bdellovibrionales bacterium]|nr:hypothetical protein [Bdellovibrionales bacterium]